MDLEALLAADGLPPDHRYGSMPNTLALIAVTAANAREFAGGVAWTPKDEDPEAEGAAKDANPWHGEIIGPIKGSASRKLRDSAVVIRSDMPRTPA